MGVRENSSIELVIGKVNDVEWVISIQVGEVPREEVLLTIYEHQVVAPADIEISRQQVAADQEVLERAVVSQLA